MEPNDTSEIRQRLLEKLRRGELAVSNGSLGPPIPRLPAAQRPLSPGQEQLWVHAQLASNAPIYNESVTIHKRGPLDPVILRRCLNEIARRHEIWRSAFPLIDGKPMQRVDPLLDVNLPLVDLSPLPAEEREKESVRIATEDVRRPFDLNVAPLFRVRLVRWSPDYHRLYLTVHHLVFDGVSIYRVFISELGTLYRAYSSGLESPLPELSVQYGDYAAWKRQQSASASLDAQMKYWRETLSEDPPSLDLPVDRPRRAEATFQGGMETCTIPAPLVAGIKALAGREGVTPYMILLTVFQVLLYRYSGQDEIIVGGATNTRTRPELEPLIGYFLNAVVYRTRIDGNLSFRAYLQSVKSTVLGALANSEIPFDAVARELAPKRDANRHPLFQVLFSMRPPFADFPEGWDLTDMEVHSGATGFDLFVELSEHPGSLEVRFVYSTDLFDRNTIVRLQTHFQELLKLFVADSDQILSGVRLLTESERRKVLIEWNNTAKSFPNQLIHELFEAQVEQHASRCALLFRGEKLTYEELNARSNQLAHYLRANGVSNGAFIGVHMERSFEMVVALLAILKSGGAYIPFDPELPPSRLQAMLEDSQPVLVLTTPQLEANLAACGVKALVLTAGDERLAAQPVSNPLISLQPTDAIYAIYTSGSTGLPKAAINTHEAVANRIFWMQDQYRLEASDRVLQKTPYSFDVSVWEFFWPLTFGATLVIAEPGGHRDPGHIADTIQAEHITTIHFVPSMLREFLDTGNLDHCRSLKRVFSSGEALASDLRQKFFERFNAFSIFPELHNLYGPTEAAVDVTYWDCREPSPCSTVPIGRPIANVKTYILDSQLQPVPIGSAGELYLGGIALARGYLNRPELTAQRFIPDPFHGEPGARLYKTGDRARYLPDGNIEYLGRNDTQVKLRGFRIELGEIESNILRHAQVRNAVVLLQQDRNGEGYLAGYVVPQDPTLEIQELKAFLRTCLPEYMVPARFVLLESLPLLSNGKLNRNALPEPSGRDASESELVGARNAVEEQLMAIWEELLDHRPIGIRDNFFELGGHSVLLLRLISQIKDQFGQKLSLTTVFTCPTVEALAAVISNREQSAAVCSVIPLKPEGTRPPFICLGAGPTFLPLARLLGPDQPFYGLDLTPLNDVRLPDPCGLEDLAGYVVDAIRDFQPKGPYALGGWCLYGLLAYEAAHRLASQGAEVQPLVLFDTSNTAYARNLPLAGRMQRMAQKWRYHLENLTQTNASGMIHYSIDHTKSLLARIRNRRHRLGVSTMPENADPQRAGFNLQDIDQIVFGSAEKYTPPPYSGRVVMVHGADTPRGSHWQLAVQWRDTLLGNWSIRQVEGGHTTMFRAPYVEKLAAVMRAEFEPSSCMPNGKRNTLMVDERIKTPLPLVGS